MCAWVLCFQDGIFQKQLHVNLAGTWQAETSDRVNFPTFNHRRLNMNALAWPQAQFKGAAEKKNIV